MNYKKILCDFQNFIKEYLSLEHKQHKILDLNLSEVHLLKIAEQNPNYTLIEYLLPSQFVLYPTELSFCSHP